MTFTTFTTPASHSNTYKPPLPPRPPSNVLNNTLPPGWPTAWCPTHSRTKLVSIYPDGVGLGFIGKHDYDLEEYAALARANDVAPEYHSDARRSHHGTNLPMYYFEVHIYEAGKAGAMSIGFVRPDMDKDTHMPGMLKGSVGWRGDDGSLRKDK
ncbi:hypothetical protein HGRIS_002130 [Hohenbuehelia grisea]|uniref:Uncharacterized protein n=1 Tax=Hohenbuehelia grisea TaxID=104357 RepID=A0ABR3JLH6_9AGAR